MRLDRKRIGTFLDGAVSSGTIIVGGLAGLCLLFQALTHFPFFDEALHTHYLWLFSENLRPDEDFFCVYPALGYLLTLPYFRIFPETAFVLLGLRCLSLLIIVLIGGLFYRHGKSASGDWVAGILPFLLVVKAAAVGAFFSEYSIDHLAALAALSAMLIFFSAPGLRSAAAAAALATLSILITPKYPLPLFFGLLGYLAAEVLKSRRVAAPCLAAAAGAAAALLGVLLIFWLSETSWKENFRHSILLNFRWSVRNADFGLRIGDSLLLRAVGEFLLRQWVFCSAVVLGLAGWLRRSWRNPDAVALAGGGVLLGTLLSSLLIKDYLSQYVAPAVLCLALFVPYAFSQFPSANARRVLRLLFVAGALFTVSSRLTAEAQEFHATPFNARGVTGTSLRVIGDILMSPPGIQVLSGYAEILGVIPKGERVVAVWPFHPILRRDLTPIAFDERVSYSFSLSADDPARSLFDPRAFGAALEQHPPAMIHPLGLEVNYPPGWKQVAEDFLNRHREDYVLQWVGMFELLIRRDLIE